MPKPPKGFDVAAAVLDEFDAAMKAALLEPHEGKRKAESTWGVAAVNRKRTRAVCDLHRKGAITKEVLDFCVKANFIDGSLVKLWSVKGYESACCVECVNPKNHSFGGACICRVPRKDRSEDAIQCSHCGCTGCASGDKRAAAAAKANPDGDGEATAAAPSDEPTAAAGGE